jgi:hypothetical protein
MQAYPIHPELRAELQQITERVALSQHRAEFRALGARHAHSITWVADANTGPNGYNCFMYAFGIQELTAHLVKVALRHDTFPDSCFAAHMIATRLVEAAESEIEDGSIVMYFGSANPKHAGIVVQNRVVSKWGTGHLWQHTAFEVPTSYGNTIRVFRRLDSGEVLDRFQIYVERLVGKGVF